MFDWMGGNMQWTFQALDNSFGADYDKKMRCVLSIFSGKMIGLPDEFLTNRKGSKGGGVIQVSLTFE